MLNSLIKFIVQFGLESLKLLHKHRSNLPSVEIKYFGRVAGNTRRGRVRNERTRGIKLKGEGQSLSEVIEEIQLKWLRHTFRMAEEQKFKEVMEVRVHGRTRI